MNEELELKMKLSRLSFTEVTVKSESDYYGAVWCYTVKKASDGTPRLTVSATEEGIRLDMKECALNPLELDKIKKLLPSIGQKAEPVVEQIPTGQRVKTVILKWSDGSETNPPDAFEVLHDHLLALAKENVGKNFMTDGPGMMKPPEMPMGMTGMGQPGMSMGMTGMGQPGMSMENMGMGMSGVSNPSETQK